MTTKLKLKLKLKFGIPIGIVAIIMKILIVKNLANFFHRQQAQQAGEPASHRAESHNCTYLSIVGHCVWPYQTNTKQYPVVVVVVVGSIHLD